MKYCVECWTISSKDDEEPIATEMVDSEECDTPQDRDGLALAWLDEGFWVKTYDR